MKNIEQKMFQNEVICNIEERVVAQAGKVNTNKVCCCGCFVILVFLLLRCVCLLLLFGMADGSLKLSCLCVKPKVKSCDFAHFVASARCWCFGLFVVSFEFQQCFVCFH